MSDGALSVHPFSTIKKKSHLELQYPESNQAILHRLIFACYMSHADTFSIELKKKLDFAKVLDQKKLMSLELVEIDHNHITSESTMSIPDPAALLKTMIKKVKNLIMVMKKQWGDELIGKYEEEIDRSKLLIKKGVVYGLVKGSNHKAIDLFYIAQIAQHLERMVDHLICLKKPQPKLLNQLEDLSKELLVLMESQDKMRVENILSLQKKIAALENVSVKDVETYDRRRAIRSWAIIAEIIMDWAVLQELE